MLKIWNAFKYHFVLNPGLYFVIFVAIQFILSDGPPGGA